MVVNYLCIFLFHVFFRSLSCLQKIGFEEEEEEETEVKMEIVEVTAEESEEGEEGEEEGQSSIQEEFSDSQDGREQEHQQQQQQQQQLQLQLQFSNSLPMLTNSRSAKSNRGKNRNGTVAAATTTTLNGEDGSHTSLFQLQLQQHQPHSSHLLPVNFVESGINLQHQPSATTGQQQLQVLHLPTNKIINSKQFAQGKGKNLMFFKSHFTN